jgi:hypothetical protein
MPIFYVRRAHSSRRTEIGLRGHVSSILVFALVCSPQIAEGQHTVMLDTVGGRSLEPAVSATAKRQFGQPDRRGRVQSASIDKQPRRWPWFMLGGGIVGGAATAGFALASCDQGCKDDGGLAFIPYIVAIGAAVGALIGALIGVAVDAH